MQGRPWVLRARDETDASVFEFVLTGPTELRSASGSAGWRLRRRRTAGQAAPGIRWFVTSEAVRPPERGSVQRANRERGVAVGCSVRRFATSGPPLHMPGDAQTPNTASLRLTTRNVSPKRPS